MKYNNQRIKFNIKNYRIVVMRNCFGFLILISSFLHLNIFAVGENQDWEV